MGSWRDESSVIISTDTNTKFPTGLKNGAQGEKKNPAIKIPSSLGLFIVDSSCFFVSGPEVERKKKKTKLRIALAHKQNRIKPALNSKKMRHPALICFSD